MPQSKPLDLSDIKFSNEDGSQPAKLDLTPEGGDPGIGEPGEATPTTTDNPDDDPNKDKGGENHDENKDDPNKQPDGTKKDGEGEPGGDNKDNAGTGDDNPDNSNKDGDDPSKKEDKSAADPNAELPFHKHPDWIKREAELEAMRKELAELKGQKQVDPKETEQAQKDAELVSKNPLEVATLEIQNQEREGKKKFDDIDERNIAIQKRADQVRADQAQAQQRINVRTAKEINTIFSAEGVTSDDEKKKVNELVMSWIDNGVVPNGLGIIKVAIKQLKDTKQIGVVTPPPATLTPEEQKAADDKAKADADAAKAAADAKKNANSKINKPKNKGEGAGAGEKKSIDVLRNQDLDTMVLSLGESLK